MSNGSNHNDEEAGREEDRLPFPTQESGDAQPTDDHFRSYVRQEIWFNPLGETLHNLPPGVFYSIHLPPSPTTNSDYHSIRPPNNTIHFRNYRPDQSRRYSDDINAAATADIDDAFGHSDLSEFQLDSYDAGAPGLREVILGERNLFDIPVESSLLETGLCLEVNGELYAIARGDDCDEMDQTRRKFISGVVAERQEVLGEEVDVEQMSSAGMNPPTAESTVSQRSGEQNVILKNASETIPRQPPSTSGYQTGTEPGRVQPVDNLQTLVKRENQEPTQHPEQNLEAGAVGDLQVQPQLSPASEFASRMARHTQRQQEPQSGEEMDESDVSN
ncbi:uncharacterized protein [Haliotis asinina]|uniref:uncharacterized protein n=1 Tax=Haliotis asinina TaxID=109174 RepID=UPI00353225E3